MKSLVSIAFVCFFCALFFGQEISLPIVKHGNWYLLKEGKEIQLPAKYTFVNFFDKQGFSYFQVGQKYGIINEKGIEVIAPKFSDISAYGNGFFSCKMDSAYHFVNINSSHFPTILCQNAYALDMDWVFIQKKNDEGIIANINSSLLIPADSSLDYQVSYNHLFIFKDSNTTLLYNPNGELIYTGKTEINERSNFTYIFGQEFAYIMDNYGFWNFPKNAVQLSIDDENINYQENGVAYLLDRLTKKEIISYPCDKISKRKNYFEIEKNDLHGIIDQNKKIRIDVKYNFIDFKDKFIYTHFNTLKGIYDYQFNELIPCKYKSIQMDNDFFYTFGLNTYSGLYSRITNREILPAVYDKIEIKNLLVKARYNGILTIVELDKKHKIINKIALGEALTLRTRDFNKAKNFTYDPRLLEIGWFFDTVLGKSKGVKWGIKNPNDSIILKAKYNNVFYVENAPFSIIKEEFTKAEVSRLKKGKTYLVDHKFSLIDFSNGRNLKTTILYHIDTLDFTRRTYARFKDSINYGIVLSDNKIKTMTFIDLEEADNLRYCYAQARTMTLNMNETSVKGYALNKMQNYLNFDRFNLEFKEAKWNFLDRNGDSLFQEPFDFVQTYYKNSAIVMRKNTWGVVKNDSIVIPIDNSSVKRLKEYQDTAFLLSKNQRKALFLDSNLNLIKDLKLQFDAKHGSIVVFKNQNKSTLYNTAGTKIFETEKSIKFHKFDRFVVKDKKVFLIYDANGNMLGEVKSKPEKFVSEDLFIVENSGKQGILSVNEDTLLPVNFTEIIFTQTYILAKSLQENALYSSDFILIKASATKKIMLDSLSNLWALVDTKKIQVFDINKKMISKFKTNEINFTQFHNKLFYSKQGKSIVDLTGKFVDFKLQFHELHVLENGYFALENEHKVWKIFNQKLEKIADEVIDIRKITYLGEDVFALKTRLGFIIYDARNHSGYSDYKNAIPNWEEGLLLVEKRAGKFPFEYLNRDFENPFHRSFKTATVFLNGLASISDERGWTVIDKMGLQKSYPNFNKIDNLAKNMFLTSAKTLYGISDQNGKIIIPVNYEKLTFISDKIIQGIKEGHIYYFDYQGNVIYNKLN